MNLFLAISGTMVVIITLHDVFHHLVHPAGKGFFSSFMMKSAWRVYRAVGKRRKSALVLAGPTAFLLVMLSWTALLACGWALIYWSQLPEGFTLSSGMKPEANDSFMDALYLSLVAQATLGYGDIAPATTWLRIVAPIQALVGFGMLTAGITWLLSVYPALSKSRALANSITLVHRYTRSADSWQTADPTALSNVLLDIGWALRSLRSDMAQFPITYYFHTQDEESALPAALPLLFEIVERYSKEGSPASVRLACAMLSDSMDGFAKTLASMFLKTSETSTTALLQQYKNDHFYSKA